MALVPSETSDSTIKGMVGATPPSLSLGEMMAQRTAALKPYKEEAEAKAKKSSEFEAEKGVFEQEQKMRTAGAKYAAMTAAQQKAEAAYEPVESLEQDMLNATFVPTQESAKDLAALYGLIGVVGWAIGSGGKGNAMRAMSAQNGMLEGYQKGRADLYKKEKDLFETNIKALREKAKVVSEKARRVAELAAKDPQAAAELSTYLSAQEGAEFYKNNVEKFGYAKAATDAAETYKAADKIYAEIVKEHFRAAKRTGKPVPMTGSDGNTYQLFPDGTVEKVEVPAGVKLTKPTVEKTAKAKDGTVGATKATGAKGNVAGSVERMTQSMGQASDALTNLARLPVTTTNPVYGQSTFNSLFTAPLSVLNQKMSDDTSQMMKTRMAAVSRTLASLETGGAATGLVGLTKSIEDGVAIPAGSSVVVALDKLAEMRRIVETASRIALASPNYSSSQKDEIQNNLNLVRKAIPYTQEDLDLALRSSEGKGIKLSPQEKNMTFTDFVKKHGLGEKTATTEKKQMPTGEKLKAYTEAHPEFGGNEEKAKEYLRSQGYE